MEISSKKDEIITKNRFKDLAEKSYNQNIFTFTSFLSLIELSLFWEIEKEINYVKFEIFGGRNNSDRTIIRFGDSEAFGYEEDFPISIINIKPLSAKMADALTHRDFLGALMNLGIERTLLGDIIVGDKEAFLFARTDISDFICDNLFRVKHTSVSCSRVKNITDIEENKAKLESHTISSERLDVIIATVYNLSRNKSNDFFSSKKVFINGRVCENNAKVCKERDTITVRGLGKFIYYGSTATTRKGKYRVVIKVYR